jgi:hypothetical protein
MPAGVAGTLSLRPVRRGLLTTAAGTPAVATDLSATRTGRQHSRLSGPLNPDAPSAVAALPFVRTTSLSTAQLLSPHGKRSDRHALHRIRLMTNTNRISVRTMATMVVVYGYADSLERPQGLSGSGGVGQSSDHCQNERFSLICLRADVRLWEEPVNKNRLHAVWSRNSFRETLYSLAFFMRTWNLVSLNGMGELAVWGRRRHHGDSLQSCQGRQSRRLLTTAFR